ncbi:acyl-coenzyme A thioesterase 13-like [Culicoides brevitarsis]|uniref:acyl-coenzyme A thioesterase 13-like n=1 Tax=Culicoides brevitarsis TaxID=469753 RepID=UPI00307BEC46
MCKKGLDFIKTVATYMSKTDGYDRLMKNVVFTAGGSGNVTAELKVAAEHLNRGGGLHGGFIATLIDQVTTIGLMTHPKNPSPGVSVDLSVSYLKGAREGDDIVIDAKTLKSGANLAFTTCTLTNKKDGSIIAHGNHTKFVGSGGPKKE